MISCFLVSDLHGSRERYARLFGAIAAERPRAVFLAGDLLPSFVRAEDQGSGFVADVLGRGLAELRDRLNRAYPRVFVILGNDDLRHVEDDLRELSTSGLCEYINEARVCLDDYDVYGYAYVPPTPFLNKDWERYDVSRYVDPGSVSPEEGFRTVPVAARKL